MQGGGGGWMYFFCLQVDGPITGGGLLRRQCMIFDLDSPASIYCSSIVSGTMNMFHLSPPTNNRYICDWQKICIYYWHISKVAIPYCSLENMTCSGLRKQNIQAQNVYYFYKVKWYGSLSFLSYLCCNTFMLQCLQCLWWSHQRCQKNWNIFWWLQIWLTLLMNAFLDF